MEQEQEKESNNKYIFPKWSNSIPKLIMLLVLGGLSSIVFVFWFWFSPKNLEVGYEPEQPIPYSHKLHVGELGIDCRYCHTNVEDVSHANIPSTDTCMNCHSVIKTDSEHIKKLKKSYDTGEPIPWVNVHMLPEYSYFNHSRHVNSGVGCVSCHGRIDQMEVVRQVESLSMSWCLECHREPAKNIRPLDKITDMEWVAEDPIALGENLIKEYHVNPKENCSTCHR
ncbi:cytochrome C [Candidatus Marinamargulisbacteria bacterium SCGC AG-410-N11]|nr:cytochrome C [Candidatus Marinamargulisbacteria bacterium SCGC AG-410-N11]